MKPVKTALLALFFASGAGHTAELGCENEIMSCTFRGGLNIVQVCNGGSTVIYRYGSTSETPDLELIEPITTVNYVPWSGVGRSVGESVSFANGPFQYEVITGFSRPMEDRKVEPSPTHGRISVTEHGAQIARLTCDVGSVQWSYGGGLFDAKTGAGLCWKPHPDSKWMPCKN